MAADKGKSKNKKETKVNLDVVLLIILAFSVFLIIAGFGKCGVFGDVISGFFFGLIGTVAYVFPIYLFLSSAFLMSNRFAAKIRNKVIYIGILMVVFSMLCQLIYSSDFESVKDLYMSGYKEHAGGGIICGGLFFLLRSTIGIPGVIIVMVILTVIMLLLITEISLSDIYDKFSEFRYDEDEEEERVKPKKKQNAEKTDRSKRARKQDISESVPDGTKEHRSTRRIQNIQVGPAKQKPKDFFAVDEEVHEINSLGENRLKKSDGVEKIIMADSIDEISAEDARKSFSAGKTRKRVQAQPVKKKEIHKSNALPDKIVPEMSEDTAASSASEDYEDFDAAAAEDILANAVNGNLHPETVNDLGYNPEFDSAFAVPSSEKTQAKKNDKQVQKPAAGGKSYKAGAKYKFPPVSLLSQAQKGNASNRDAYVKATAIKLKTTLENFGVDVTITNYSCGPAVTRFEMQPDQGVKVSKILSLSDDIKLALAAADIRIEAPIPGKSAIGIEVPNKEKTIVTFRELVESDNYKKTRSKIPFAVGKDISGQVIVGDIAKMPHVLIAGATGSGKSVCINTLIMSILYNAKPEDVKLIMIDPKMVELSVYNGLPHLLIPVVTDPKKASGALNWAVEEMTRRYQLFAECQVRNMQGYNEKVDEALSSGDVDSEKLQKMPYIVIIVDELSDLMMVAHGEVEDAIVRLSQLARAAGIHLVIATQRPSVDVITGLIKANVPSRIAFAVSSGVDSRTILDMIGAEKLLGYGDMLFYPTGYPKPVRVQGAFASDEEVNKVVEYIKKNNGVGNYDEEISKSIISTGAGSSQSGGSSNSGRDDYFIEAGRFIIEQEKASIGMLQRKFRIGFNRAARIMDQLSDAGVVGPEEGTKARKITMSQEQFDQYIEDYV